ncbi:hypothetical protein C8Q79DRAFT_50037 [Trametes meyenii]|nr:hypothetical protein C8Q79DRAFT_50037 [Trametes meyenii]
MAPTIAIVDAWSFLEITSVVQSVLCALFGVYFSLFILAIWAIHGRRRKSSRRLQIITAVLFVDLSVHFIVRSLQFARAREARSDSEDLAKWNIPLVVMGNVTTTFAGLCSDSLLVWRFYVLFNHQRWTLYVPATFVALNALLCWSADLQPLVAYTNYELYEHVLLDVSLKLTVAWGWVMFAINTALSGAIVTKIFIIARWSGQLRTYETVIRACIESALVTWVGLLLYEICSLAPTGHIVARYDVGYVVSAVLPVFFGISQCLIVVRVALIDEFGRSKSGASSPIAFAHPSPRRSELSAHHKIISQYAETTMGASGAEEHLLDVLPTIKRGSSLGHGDETAVAC